MTIYALGDIQGCQSVVERLLRRLRFDPSVDTLWLCGDLVNRGPASLETLRWACAAGTAVVSVLGNHDLKLLRIAYGTLQPSRRDTLQAILQAPDASRLLDWLCQRPLLHVSETHALVHAGILPTWSLATAQKHAQAIAAHLAQPKTALTFLEALNASCTAWETDQPDAAAPSTLTTLVHATQVFTYMRVCTPSGALYLNFNGPPQSAPAGIFTLVCLPPHGAVTTQRYLWPLVGARLIHRTWHLCFGQRLCLGTKLNSTATRQWQHCARAGRRHTVREDNMVAAVSEVTIAPSLLAANFACLGEQVAQVTQAGADWLHLDVMDGHFVPNLTFGPPVIAALRPLSRLPFDVHLMIEAPERSLAAYAQAGADHLTVHVEAQLHLHRTLSMIRDLGKKVGVSLNPATPVQAIGEVLHLVDLVLVMSVNPGFGGQAFIPQVLPKLAQLQQLRAQQGLNFLLAIDGGINNKTLPAAASAGAQVFVAGSAIFGQSDWTQAITQLRAQAPLLERARAR